VFKRLPSPSALRTFEACARLGSFKAAANELAVSATAVSHQIRTLEKTLGLALFVRKTRLIELTAAGAELSPVITRAFLDIHNTLEHISAEKNTLTVSTTASFATLRLVPKLVDFYTQHPDFRVHLDTTTNPLDLLDERQIDVAIRYGQGAYPGLYTNKLLEGRFGVYRSPNYPSPPLSSLATQDNIRLIDTHWQQPVFAEVSWVHWLAAAGLSATAPRVVHFEQEHNVIQAAIAGQGLALVNAILVADLVEQNILVPYHEEVQLSGASYTVLCVPEHQHTHKVDTFLGWLDTSFNTRQ